MRAWWKDTSGFNGPVIVVVLRGVWPSSESTVNPQNSRYSSPATHRLYKPLSNAAA